MRSVARRDSFLGLRSPASLPQEFTLAQYHRRLLLAAAMTIRRRLSPLVHVA
jgi:hypothetical protein